jgi:hypothetical protein
MLTRVTRTGATWSLLLALASVGLFYLADPRVVAIAATVPLRLITLLAAR